MHHIIFVDEEREMPRVQRHENSKIYALVGLVDYVEQLTCTFRTYCITVKKINLVVGSFNFAPPTTTIMPDYKH